MTKKYGAYVHVSKEPDLQGSYEVIVGASISTQIWTKEIAELFASMVEEAIRERGF